MAPSSDSAKTCTSASNKTNSTLACVYTGSAPVPDTFKDGVEAVCEGSTREDGTFEARQIQAKCASKYQSENTAQASGSNTHAVGSNVSRGCASIRLIQSFLKSLRPNLVIEELLANFGNLALTLAFSVTLYAVLALFLGWRTHRRELVKSGEYAVYASCLLVTAASIALFYLFATLTISMSRYVAKYSNADLPMAYKLAAFWGGQQGSLLFWTWVLVIFSAIITFQNRHRRSDLVTVALDIISINGTLFSDLLTYICRKPVSSVSGLSTRVTHTQCPLPRNDGRGLNPLLQHPIMVIHPPVLFIGYVGFVVPAAFALAALVTRELGNAWITLIRRWALLAWGFLGIGIILGAAWAYVELGWGGYWAWDPVENASFMPWLTGTAFLHSAIVQEKKNMLKIWNIVAHYGDVSALHFWDVPHT